MSQSIINRLTEQLRAKGISNARGMAIAQLQKNGILHPNSEELTSYGKTRQSMSPGERAISRQVKYTGNKPSDYQYNSNTNRATLKKKK